MQIHPEAVVRDSNGFWTHSCFPEWDESTEQKTVDKWFSEHHLTYVVDEFDSSDSATDEMRKAYFDEGLIGIPDWQPACELPGAFLLSIHDTEDGPVAIYAVPV